MDNGHMGPSGEQAADKVPATGGDRVFKLGAVVPAMNTNPPVEHMSDAHGDYTVSLHVGNRDNDGYEQEAGMRALRAGFQIKEEVQGHED